GLVPRGWWSLTPAGVARRVRADALVGCFAIERGRVTPRAPGDSCEPALAADESDLPTGHFTALADVGGTLYAGSFDRGLYRRAAGASELEAVDGAPRFINALLADGDRLWIATPKGLYSLSADGVIDRIELGLPSDHVNSLARGRDGTIWLATGQGVIG